MIDELYRVLAPGGRYVTFSLHAVHEIESFFREERHHWHASVYPVKSNRWNETTHCRRAVACTLIVVEKQGADGNYALPYPLSLKGTMTQEELEDLVKLSDEVCCCSLLVYSLNVFV